MSRSHPLVLLFLAAFLFVTLPVAAQDESTAFAPRNVILFIPDGFGPSMATMARDYRRDYLREGSSLAMDAIETGSVRTFSTSQRVTDSAAGATAFATGVKSYNGAISVDTTGQPVGTVLEAARRKGMLTGVVTTTRVTHATPAAFTAHVPRRAMESEIAEQQLVTRPDIIMGGGAQFFLPEDKGGRRTDNRDLIDEADALGYTVARSLADVRSANTIPLLALLAMDQMAYEVDRDETAEPSLAEMTAKSLELLGDHPEGFFLMVEAARIDHAAHGNDAAGTLHDVLAFDAALNVALDFARRDGQTLLISVADHETGGLSLGRNIDGRGEYAWYPDVLAKVTSSHGPMIEAIIDRSEPYDDVLREYAGIDDLSDEERALLDATQRDSRMLGSTLGEIIGRRAVVGWTTGGHTGVDVRLHAMGPGSQLLVGNFDNTAIGIAIARMLGLDLDAVTEDLRSGASAAVVRD